MVVKSGCKGAAVWGGEEVTSAHPSCTEWRVSLSSNFLNNLQPNVHRGFQRAGIISVNIRFILGARNLGYNISGGIQIFVQLLLSSKAPHTSTGAYIFSSDEV